LKLRERLDVDVEDAPRPARGAWIETLFRLRLEVEHLAAPRAGRVD